MAFCERRDCYAVTRYIFSSRTARTKAPTQKERRLGVKRWRTGFPPRLFHHFKEFEGDGIICRTLHSRHDYCMGALFFCVCVCVRACVRACVRVCVVHEGAHARVFENVSVQLFEHVMLAREGYCAFLRACVSVYAITRVRACARPRYTGAKRKKISFCYL